MLTDSTMAAWLRGAGGAAASLPVSEFTPTTLPAWDGMEAWRPLISEAHADIAERSLVLPGQYATLNDDARRQAFTVAQANTLEAVQKVRDAVAEAIDKGDDLKRFTERVGDAIGTSTLGPGHLENVFRTNVASAYAAGQDAIYKHPAVADRFPFVQTMPIRDSRLTDLCAIVSVSGLDGTGIFWADDPVWLYFRNPRHWQCRCGTIFLTVEQAATKGVRQAREWLRMGIEPAREYVEWPKDEHGRRLELPPGWEARGGVQLSFCNAYALSNRR